MTKPYFRVGKPLLLVSLAFIFQDVRGHENSCDSVGPLGNEKASLLFTPFDDTVDYRQEICDRFAPFVNGSVELKDTLQGMELYAAVAINKYFIYSEETGIDAEYPGVQARILDEIACRAGFTWRYVKV